MGSFRTGSIFSSSILSATSTTLIFTQLYTLISTFIDHFYFSVMPAIRKPLRDRCNVQLKVVTATPTGKPLESPSYNGAPTRIRRPRKSVPDVRVPYPNPVRIHAPAEPRLYPVNPRTAQGLRSLHKLVPYLYIAFHDGNRLPQSLVADDGTAFTHIIKITHETEQRVAGTVEVKSDPKRGLHSLVLVVPEVAPHRRGRRRVKNCCERNTSVLTETQILAARDFISLALPYYLEAHPRDDIPLASADVARLLITAPVGDGAASDVLSVAVCYLAFASEESAETVLDYVNNEEDVSTTWKDVIAEGEGGVDLLNKVAASGE
ncbi:hypothetical protein BDZ94DRAFT_1258462 [Collybia nuda]|uniref:Uncharacterized protein n=1 Tax=Collybia nuda TaxID=64659 RepID=A0A9P5Y7E9_9AGAR|nr:hypothetical protein BDZ94DRAFT_1258462 [Collybia nuda]